jgi:hypothetical protein
MPPDAVYYRKDTTKRPPSQRRQLSYGMRNGKIIGGTALFRK